MGMVTGDMGDNQCVGVMQMQPSSGVSSRRAVNLEGGRVRQVPPLQYGYEKAKRRGFATTDCERQDEAKLTSN